MAKIAIKDPEIKVRESGVYVKDGGKDRRICDWIKAVAVLDNQLLDKHQIRYRFATKSGKRDLILDRADAAKPSTLAAALRNKGFDLPPKPDEIVVLRWLTTAKPDRLRRLVRTTGWHEKNSIFVTPSGVIGSPKFPVSLAEPEAEYLPKFEKAGTLGGWQTGVAKPAGALSSRLTFAICAALAAPLVEIMSRLTQGIHLYGDPGIAKSSALVIAGSTYGIATDKDVPTVRASETGLDDLFRGHNGILLPLDEFGLLEGNEKARAEQVQRLAYIMASGKGKALSSVYKKQNQLQQAVWDTIVFTTSEHSLNDVVAMGGVRRSAGQESRFIDLPGSRKGSLGLIDYLPHDLKEDRQRWAANQIEALKKACQTDHGHAFPAFVEQVIANRKTIKPRIEKLMARFRRTARLEHLGGAEKRRADFFGLIYAAGRLALEWKIVPWTITQVGNALRRCYQDACQSQPAPTSLAREGVQIVQQHLAGDAIIDLRKNKPANAKEMDRADGIIRALNEGTPEVVVKANRFRAWFKSEAQHQLVLDRFIDANILKRNKARRLNTRQVRMPKLTEKPSCYVFDLNGFRRLAAGA
jgi:hypothetical protein